MTDRARFRCDGDGHEQVYRLDGGDADDLSTLCVLTTLAVPVQWGLLGSTANSAGPGK